MKKILLLAVAFGLSSCFQLKRQDYSIYESFQIGNTSPQDVTLRFYQENAPKTVYYELLPTASPVYPSRDKGFQDESALQSGSVVKIAAGQTLLLYSKDRQWHPGTTEYSCLYICGSSDRGIGDGVLYTFSNRRSFVGDSVTVAAGDEAPSVLPVTRNEQWETWYDEQQFIYYHFWRIE